jgi:uncharacterized protein
MASTPDELFEALEAGDVGRVDAMLNSDPSLASARDASGVSALMRALYRFDKALIEAVKRRVDILDVFEAAAFGDIDRLTELLGDEPSFVTSYSGDGFTALHFAAFFGRPDAARLLLERGADVDARGRGWMTGTPLHSAASAGHVDVVQILLAAGADPNARQSGGWTPLHGAAHNGDVATAALLIAAGADVTAVNDDGASVRSLAQESGDAATMAAVGSGPGQPR